MKKATTPPTAFLVLVVVQVGHSVEEYLAGLYEWLPRVTARVHEAVGFIPVMAPGGAVFALMNIILLAFLFTVSVMMFQRKRWAWTTAFIMGIVEIVNGASHFSAAIYLRGYFPGAVSAVGLIVAGVFLLRSFRFAAPFTSGAART